VGNHKAVVHSFEAAEVVAVDIAGVAVVGIAEPAVEDIAEVAAVDIVAEPAEVSIAVALAEVAEVGIAEPVEVGIAVVAAVDIVGALVLKNSQTHLQSARSQDQSLAAEQVLALACFVLSVEPLLERTLLLLKLDPGLWTRHNSYKICYQDYCSSRNKDKS
jgi:hypothetical protein